LTIGGLSPVQFTRATTSGLRPVSPVNYARSQANAFHDSSPVQNAKALRNARPSRWTDMVMTELITKHSLDNLLDQRAASNRIVISPAQLAKQWGRGVNLDVIG